MKTKKIATSMLLVATLLSSAAHAAFQSTDWKTSGDALATLDTDTGIEWLNLSQTDYKTVNMVLSEMNDGGLYYGWRLPTESEVVGLMNSFFSGFGPYTGTLNGTTVTSYSGPADSSGNLWPRLRDFHLLFGTNDSRGAWGWSGSSRMTQGAYLDDDGVTVRLGGAISYVDGGGSGYYTLLGGAGSYNTDWRDYYGYSGVFLVSDGGLTLSSVANPSLNANNPNAPVNQPPAPVSSPALFASGLVMLGLLFRRKGRNN